MKQYRRSRHVGREEAEPRHVGFPRLSVPPILVFHVMLTYKDWMAALQGRVKPTPEVFPAIRGTLLEPLLKVNENGWIAQRRDNTGALNYEEGDGDELYGPPTPKKGHQNHRRQSGTQGSPSITTPPGNYHGARKYCGPSLHITVHGGGENPQTLVGDSGKFQCSLCGDEQMSETLLNRHFVKHRVGILTCPFISHPNDVQLKCPADMQFYRW